jgi:hypothetical protein
VHKVGRTLCLPGGSEKKHDKFYLRGRACIESVSGTFEFEFFFTFPWFTAFHSICWLCSFSFL